MNTPGSVSSSAIIPWILKARNNRSLWFFPATTVFIAIILLIGTTRAFPQSAEDLNNQTGPQPFGSYHGGDIDAIDLKNGELMVKIPLISYPQRGGKLKLEYSLVYHNTGKILGGMGGCLPPAFGGPCIVFPFDSGFVIGEAGVYALGNCELSGRAHASLCRCKLPGKSFGARRLFAFAGANRPHSLPFNRRYGLSIG